MRAEDGSARAWTRALRSGALILALLLGVVGLPGVGAAQSGCDDTVSGGESIQTAIDDASAGDTICVEPGTYSEALEIDTSVALLGPNAGISPITGDRGDEAVIAAPGEDAILLTEGADLTVDGFLFDEAGRFLLTEDVGNGSPDPSGWGDVDLRNNAFRNAASAIGGYFWFRDDPGEQLVFQDNLLTGNDVSNGLRVRAIQRSDPGAGLVEIDVSGNVWEDNGALAMNLNNVDGVVVDNEIRNTAVTGDDLENQMGFLLATEDTDLEVRGNTFEDLTFAGVWLSFGFSGALEVTDNTFTGISSEDFADGAILVDQDQDIAEVAVHFNAFEGNDIAVSSSTDGTLDALHNWWGTPLGASADQTEGDVATFPHCVLPICASQVVLHAADGPLHP